MTEPPPPVCRITLNHALAMRLAGYAINLLYVAVGIVVTLGPFPRPSVQQRKRPLGDSLLRGAGGVGLDVRRFG